MSLGLGIVLFAIGAVLAFAVNLSVEWINLQTVGIILMVAGAIVIILGIVLLARRRNSVSTSRTTVDPATGDRVTRNETSRPDDTTAV
ncbi:DUF6458 family protein [Agromyces sp. SYSU T0242]|uniref:DUF6458 family protein n=1 Tax=Agromyces litoreus TaxID=3158561 RepID=UPI00339845F8